MDFVLIGMTQRKQIVYLDVEAKPVTEEISLKDKMMESMLKNFPDGSDEYLLMKKIMPALLATMPDFDSGMTMANDGSMIPFSMKPKMTLLIDEEELKNLELKLGDIVRMGLTNLRLEKSKTSKESL